MIDIHSHILPELDDGAPDPETSLAMAKTAVSEGIRSIIATPHFIEGSAETAKKEVVVERVEELNSCLKAHNIDLTIYPGNEIFISPEIPELLKKGELATLNNSRYVLLELPMGSIPVYTESVLYEIQLLGLTPVIAHPERNREIIENTGVTGKLADKDVLFQMNAGSITGFYGSSVKKTAWKLLREGIVSFVATDAHNNRSRTPAVREAYEAVRRKFGESMALELFSYNPERVLTDEGVYCVESGIDEKETSAISSLWGSLSKLINNFK